MKWFLSLFICFSVIFLSVFGVSCVYGYLFPMKFKDEISLYSEIYDVDQVVIFSVINVESHFNPNALSSKGAMGLMQLMPSTAKDLAEKLKIEKYDLKNVENNIELGTYYIAKLQERFENVETALAAYNAGPTNVSGWLKNEQYSSDGKTLKKIPFEETKNYIEKFKTNYRYYKSKLY